jgi:hypothetical protein
MLVPPTGVRAWLASGRINMRRGMNGLALQVQEALQRNLDYERRSEGLKDVSKSPDSARLTCVLHGGAIGRVSL